MVGIEKNKCILYDVDVYQVECQVDFMVDDLFLEFLVECGNLDICVNINNIINIILLFDIKNVVKWNVFYLVGFIFEKCNLDVEKLWSWLEDQLLLIVCVQVEGLVRCYNCGVYWEQEQLKVYGICWVLMYLLVWLYFYYQFGKNGGMLYYIVVNGCIGEIMGSVFVQ